MAKRTTLPKDTQWSIKHKHKTKDRVTLNIPFVFHWSRLKPVVFLYPVCISHFAVLYKNTVARSYVSIDILLKCEKNTVLLVEGTGVPGENLRLAARHWKTYDMMLYTLPWSRFELRTSHYINRCLNIVYFNVGVI
jgi:hypothetical protein